MAENTPRLGLLKKDPIADGADTFNIKKMLNDNWDAIDDQVALVDENGKVVNKDGTPAGGVSVEDFEDLQTEVTTHKADDATDAHNATNISFSDAEMTATNVREGILEAFMLGNSTKEDLVDKLLLLDDSLPITYESSWVDILASISQISTGKKWASGEDQSLNIGRLTIEGLSFKPSIIVARRSDGSGSGHLLTNTFLTDYDTVTYVIGGSTTDGGSSFISTDGFSMYGLNGSAMYSWRAIE